KCGCIHAIVARQTSGVACGRMKRLPPVASSSTTFVTVTSPICHVCMERSYSAAGVWLNRGNCAGLEQMASRLDEFLSMRSIFLDGFASEVRRRRHKLLALKHEEDRFMLRSNRLTWAAAAAALPVLLAFGTADAQNKCTAKKHGCVAKKAYCEL